MAKNGKKKIKVIVIDDHPLFREGVVQLLEGSGDYSEIIEAGNAEEALALFEKTCVDFAIVDISLKGMNGIELIKVLKNKYPQLLMLVISMHDEIYYAQRALKAGARGYIMKQEASKNVLTAIGRIVSGKIYLSEEMRERMLQSYISADGTGDSTGIENLSDREFQVFQRIGEGLGVSEIASAMKISVKTVETYRECIKRKLLFKDAHQLRMSAIKWFQKKD
jgi:DNA-binding NarL/FixJ family response regulator